MTPDDQTPDPEDVRADALWGPGNWVRCVDCTTNGATTAGTSRHARGYHDVKASA